MFVRSHRERNFDLYINCLEKIAPLFFALDGTNYSRWLPVFLHDLKSLPSSILAQLQSGNFTVTRTKHKFSSITIDQAHEQSNKTVKGSGGAVGLFLSRDMLTKWLLVTPELSRILLEFEQQLPNWGADDDDDELQLQHHENTHSFQKRFHEKARSFYLKIVQYGNPFELENINLLKLTTQDVYDSSVTESLRKLETEGQKQYDAYVKSVLEDASKSIHDTIPKNSFPLLSTPLKKMRSSTGTTLKTVKLNNDIFSQTVAVMEHRNLSLQTLFSFEFHFFPPSISNYGEMSAPAPADKAKILEKVVTPCHNASDDPVEFEPTSMVIIDGGRIPIQFKPKANMSFDQYAEMLAKVAPINLYFNFNQRIDIVFDTYMEGSLRTAMWLKKGQGLQRDKPMPSPLG